MSRETQGFYEFGRFRLDPAQQQLFEDGEPVSLTPKAYDTLLVLVENHGRLVSKEEMLQKIWPDTFVEESALAQNLFRLRKLLGDDRNEALYIETVPKRGYRFVAAVRVVAPSAGVAESVPEGEKAAGIRRWAGRNWVAIGLTALLMAGAAGWYGAGRMKATRKSPGPGRVMLVVLPVENLTGDPSREYVSDGLTEEIIAQLGGLSPDRLGVIARTSSMVYKGTEKTVGQIGRELHVDYLVESSMRSSGDHLRVTAQLIRVRDQAHLWAEDYDRVWGDVLTFQSEVAREVADAIPLNLTVQERERLASPHAAKPEVYDAYLRGRFFWNQRTEEAMTSAEKYFRQAVEADPAFALAYAGLADCYQVMVNLGQVTPADGFSHARAAALKALELDNRLAEAHTSLASIKGDFDWDWQGAETEYRQALALNPNYATAHHWYGEFLAGMGRFDEGTVELKKAQELDPLSPVIGVTLGQMYCRAGRCDQAIEQFHKTLEIYPDFGEAHEALAETYGYLGRYEQALEEMDKVRQPPRGHRELLRGYAYAVAGHRAEALSAIGELQKLPDREYANYSSAIIYAALGDNDHAFARLETARQMHDPYLAYLRADITLEKLHSDPRYRELLRRMNMPE